MRARRVPIVLALLAILPLDPGVARSFPPFIVGFAPGDAKIGQAEQRVIAAAVNSYRDAQPDAALRVGGHADRVGSEEFNQRLSCARAEAVRTALMASRVPAGRIILEGYGEQRPSSDTTDGVAHPANRRVEIELIPWPAQIYRAGPCR